MLDPAIHKKILLQILTDIYSDKAVGPFLGFKGGTAAYLFYGLDRFSVDLDFDLIDEKKEDQVFKGIKEIIEKYGTVKEAEKKRFYLIFVLSYDQKVKNAQNIKIEINRRNFGAKYDLKSYMGISMLVMTKEDMFAHKLMAMYERLGKTNRDIYDVCFFAKNNWPISKEAVKQRLEITFKELLKKLISGLEKFNDHNILDGLGELLTDKQKAWVKTNLKKETLLSLKIMLESER
jgi:predicted nucleotidyltransferase component of viral defense system